MLSSAAKNEAPFPQRSVFEKAFCILLPKDVIPWRSPGMGRSAPFLPISKPRRGVNQSPINYPNAMGPLAESCVSPFQGL